ncbi:hypothetical protein JZ751_023177 [Albula glossodonta]|uniref:CWF21 domain-containing protein n=1 Tax=Albula glossodonta TaxID=121402 RepID=A0A8T2PJH4_9TELE|nr:hypothetical protein JZ751_023177 [Albula glossodonta]
MEHAEKEVASVQIERVVSAQTSPRESRHSLMSMALRCQSLQGGVTSRAEAMYDGARVPSPQDSANGFPPQPGASTSRPKSDDEEPKPEPVLVKKAHREILDHERKRRVELKCMELQEMMEEQGVHLKACHQEENALAPTTPAWLQDETTKRKSSSSPSPPPKKRKKKKSARRRSRFDSASPSRKEKKKKSGKKHKRDRSASGSRKKRRYRSPVDSPGRRSHRRGSCSSRSASVSSTGSLSKSPSRPSLKHRADGHKGCPSLSSASPSPTRTANPSSAVWQNGHRGDTRNGRDGGPNHYPGEKPQDALRLSAASPGGQTLLLPQPKEVQAYDASRGWSPGGRLSAPLGGEEGAVSLDEARQGPRRSPSPSSTKRRSRLRPPGQSAHSPAPSSDSTHSHGHEPPANKRSKNAQQKKTRGARSSKRRHRNRTQARHRSSSASPARHSGRRASGRKKSSTRSLRPRSSSWSSERSASGSASRSHSREHGSKTKSPHSRQNTSRYSTPTQSYQNDSRYSTPAQSYQNTFRYSTLAQSYQNDSRYSTPAQSYQNTFREKDSAHHTDSESRARRRSRSYSPIRKRRRDSPSFMEARRITSARKRPIPYYRPSPSSSSSLSSHSGSSRSRSRSYDSYSSYSRSPTRSRSRSPTRSRSRSRTRSPSRNHSYYSRSSSESPGF